MPVHLCKLQCKSYSWALFQPSSLCSWPTNGKVMIILIFSSWLGRIKLMVRHHSSAFPGKYRDSTEAQAGHRRDPYHVLGFLRPNIQLCSGGTLLSISKSNINNCRGPCTSCKSYCRTQQHMLQSLMIASHQGYALTEDGRRAHCVSVSKEVTLSLADSFYYIDCKTQWQSRRGMRQHCNWLHAWHVVSLPPLMNTSWG